MSTLGRVIAMILKSDLLLPAILILVYVGLFLIVRGVMPTTDELVDSFAKFYAAFGYEIIFVASFLEALILVNFFVPGQLAMALGVIFARTGHTDLTPVILTAVTGSFLGYNLDYFLGYYGFSDFLKKLGYGNLLNEAKIQLHRFGKRGLIVGFIHSNIGSFLSLIAGATGVKWSTFVVIALFSTLTWSVLWGMLIYAVGDVILLIIRKYSFLVVLLGIGSLILSRFWKSSSKHEFRN